MTTERRESGFSKVLRSHDNDSDVTYDSLQFLRDIGALSLKFVNPKTIESVNKNLLIMLSRAFEHVKVWNNHVNAEYKAQDKYNICLHVIHIVWAFYLTGLQDEMDENGYHIIPHQYVRTILRSIFSGTFQIINCAPKESWIRFSTKVPIITRTRIMLEYKEFPNLFNGMECA